MHSRSRHACGRSALRAQWQTSCGRDMTEALHLRDALRQCIEASTLPESVEVRTEDLHTESNANKMLTSRIPANEVSEQLAKRSVCIKHNDQRIALMLSRTAHAAAKEEAGRPIQLGRVLRTRLCETLIRHGGLHNEILAKVAAIGLSRNTILGWKVGTDLRKERRSMRAAF